MSLISCLIITSLISCNSSHVSMSCHSSHVSISCHSSHVTHLMSRHYVTHLLSHQYVTHLMSLISCHTSHVASFWHISSDSFLSRSHVTHPMPLSDLSIPYVLLVSQLIQLIPVSISCHSSHVTHIMSHHYLTHLMSHHLVTHLMSHHWVTDAKLLTIYSRVAKFNFCPWPLPTLSTVVYAHLQRPSARKDRNRVSWCLSLISVSISCHSSHVSSLRH